MNRKELYEKTVNVLLDAYNNDELYQGNCNMCAVGNICKESSEKLGIPLGKSWSRLFMTVTSGRNIFGILDINNRRKDHNKIYDKSSGWSSRETAIKLVESTGYSVYELYKIEFVFEKAKGKTNSKEKSYNGLVAVLNKLKEIHEVNIEQVSTETKEKERVFKEEGVLVEV